LPNVNIYWLPMRGIVLVSWHNYTEVIGLNPFGMFLVSPTDTIFYYL